MTKTRNKLKIMGLLLTVALLISSLGIFSLTASAAEAEALTVTIDTGASVTLQDADGNGFYDIGTADELYAFAAAVNGGKGTIDGELTADIVVNENVLDENGELNGDGSNFRVWTPIGLYVDSYDAATVFHGQFNGNNHTVSGLYFNDENQSRVGLFGCTNGASIQNVGVFDCYINGYQFVGGVVGFLRSGTLENCYNVGSVLGDSNVGGVAGWAGKSSTIQNCFNNGNVSGRNRNIGGVVGYIFDGNNSTTLKNCYSTGKIVGVSDVRGVVGAIGANTAENCFFLENTVTITGTVGNGSSVHAGTQAMSFAQFVSGEVAYKLGSAFGQTLAGENRQNYPVLGGTPVTATERFEIYGQQLNLGGDLSMKYYVAAYAPDFDPAKMTMKFIHNDVVTTPTYEIVDGFYVLTLDGINPQCMGDSIDAYVYYDGVQKAEKLGYTVEKNLTNLLAKYPDDAALVALINDILAYGKASSDYKGYPSITENYTGSGREIPEANVTLEAPFTGYTVRFGMMNYIKIGVTLTGGNRLYLNDAEVTQNVLDGTYTTAGIAPTDFATKYKFEVRESDGTTVVKALILSVNDYAYVISQITNTSENMKALAKALYNYGVSAKIYAHLVYGVGEHEGTATCVSDKICDMCGTVFGEKDPTNHVSTEFTYASNYDGTHKKIYTCCEAVHPEKDACSGGTATCVRGKICDLCGNSYGELDLNNHTSTESSYWDNGNGTHIRKFECCGTPVGEAEPHVIGGDGMCTICISDYIYDAETNTYIVYNADGLYAWNEKARESTEDFPNLTLAADITLKGENNWTPVGNESVWYDGVIDGGGHTITGLRIDSDSEYQGFIGALNEGGTVKNLIFADAIISGGQYTGIVVGWSIGTIENCHVTSGHLTATDSYAGGIVGYNLTNNIVSTIINCTNAATIEAAQGVNGSYLGGIAGRNWPGTIIGCINTGKILGNSFSCVGGRVGQHYLASGGVVACSNKGEVTGSKETGGIIGSLANSAQAYGSWTVTTTESDNSGDGVGTPGLTIIACYSGDADTINAKVNEMNEAIAAYNASAAEGYTCPYIWQVGADGYPTLVEVTE